MSAIDRPGKRRKKKGKDDEKEGKGDFYSGIASTYTAPHRRFVVCHAPWRFPLCFLLCRNDPSYLKLCFFHRKETTASEGKDWRKSHPKGNRAKGNRVTYTVTLVQLSSPYPLWSWLIAFWIGKSRVALKTSNDAFFWFSDPTILPPKRPKRLCIFSNPMELK